MSNTKIKTNETKTLIVTETVRYEFEVPASMPENEATLKRFFGRQRDPWGGADFAAVIERDFVVEASSYPLGASSEVEVYRAG